jgi:hypothetical protein
MGGGTDSGVRSKEMSQVDRIRDHPEGALLFQRRFTSCGSELSRVLQRNVGRESCDALRAAEAALAERTYEPRMSS